MVIFTPVAAASAMVASVLVPMIRSKQSFIGLPRLRSILVSMHAG